MSENSSLLFNQFSNFADLLKWRATVQPDDRVYVFLDNGETEGAVLTYQELDRGAKSVAAQLQKYTSFGDRALLLYPPGLDFLTAFFGCLYAGIVAVPVDMPRRNQRTQRLQKIVADARTNLILTVQEVLPLLEKDFPDRNIQFIETDCLEQDQSASFQPPEISRDALAFLQYTSGSTGNPKGVMVSHGNLLHNEEMLRLGFSHPENTAYVTWLPLFHDMGLIAHVLHSMYLGVPNYVMSPVAFLQKPLRWLKAIEKYRATSSGAPNFAYDLCVSKITPEQRQDLDLSSWSLAFNGAEPIRAETLQQFTQTFSECGFNPAAFYPCYGMAEATVFVTGGDRSAAPMIQEIASAALLENKIVTPHSSSSGADNPTFTPMVGCGKVWLGTEIAIVDPESLTRCAPDRVGEIWMASDSVAKGYWDRPEDTQQIFQARIKTDRSDRQFLRTGDLGFLHEGELFITGRLKDVIILRGRNHYPQDIELTVEKSHPALRENCSAAFTVEGEEEEGLVIVCEVERTHLRKLNLDEIVTAVKIAVSTEHELDFHGIVLLKTGSIPKTSSGKIQRRACKAGFLAGDLNIIEQWQKQPQKNTDSWPNSPSNSLDRQEQNHAKTVADIEVWLARKIAEIQELSIKSIDLKQPLAVYGLNSVKAVSISAELGEWLGISVAPTIIYDYPSIQSLAEHLGQPTSPWKSSPVVATSQPETEAIAIMGKGCRLPQANNPEAFWNLLRSGQDAITKIPASRWHSDHGWGGFLEGVDRFDSQFFNISPREANSIDPQQRLLLEISWEALENAGLAAEKLTGSRSGVFIGISSGDYAKLAGNLHNTEAYYGTGNALSIAANRLSYFLDWHGPSWAVDTACSSSLVAVHQACQSLLLGECNLALAGGVNLILSPQLTLTFTDAKMMAADGRCKTFDAEADGYVRSEGCGVVVLKRLSDAIADGDNIQAIIRGSAVNQDGLTNGITAPNGNSQQDVIRLALANAGVTPNQISYVETHGTGTALGDPIEINSLTNVLMEERELNQPCWIGSAKTNIGHLEAAAGIAGLIKVVLSLEHGEIPPHLHLKELNPYIQLDRTSIKIPTQIQSWSSVNPSRIAGVSAFGFGGTNAHVILEAAPVESQQIVNTQPASQSLQSSKNQALLDRPIHLLTLSAKTDQALQDLVLSYQKYLNKYQELSVSDICFSANTGRSHFNHRLSVIISDQQELADKLAKISTGAESSDVFSKQLPSNHKSPKIAFLFTGQGSQYVNMGCQLYETQPRFRQAIDECAELMKPHLDRPLLSILYPEECDSNLIDRTIYAQPTLFALEYALCQLWQSWGVVPNAVLGHSVGEYVAAVVAGVISLADGVRLVTARAKLMQSLPSTGEMIAVFTTPAEIQKVVTIDGQSLSCAAYNNPQNTVISGENSAIAAACDALTNAGIGFKQLRTSHAFHSVLMEPILAQFRQVTAAISYHPPQISLISNLTGQQLGANEIDAEYWCQHLRQTVKFADGLQTLDELGVDIFLEIGPKPTLIGIGQQCLAAGDRVWLSSLRPKREDWEEMLTSLARLAVNGMEIDWVGFDRDFDRQRISLPTYPFQRKSYWIDPPINTAPLAPIPSNQNLSFTSPNSAPASVDMTNQQRQQDILNQLHTSVAKLLKANPAEVDVNAPFLEMGADSLVLVEAIGYVERTFGIKIGIRQIFEELTTIAVLAEHIHGQLPPEIIAPEPVLAAVSNTREESSVPNHLPFSNVSSDPGNNTSNGHGADSSEILPVQGNNISSTDSATATSLERIMQQQMQIMQQQIQSQTQLMSKQLDVVQGQNLSYSSTDRSLQTNGGTGRDTQHTESLPQAPVKKTIDFLSNSNSKSSSSLFWRFDPSSGKQLSDRQQRHLAALIARYTQRTQKSKQRAQSCRSFLADKRAAIGFRFETKEMIYPITGERSLGSKVWDIDGNEYIDIAMGFGVHLFGHHAPFIMSAIDSQLQQGIHIGPLSQFSDKVALLISELTGMERVCFANSGTEAVMTAIRLARTKTGRDRVAIFKDAYHGHFDGVLAVANGSQGQIGARPMMPGVTQHAVADVLVLAYDDPASLEIIKAHAHELAAVVVEPVPSRRPDLQPQEFLQQLRQLTKEIDAALIFDEVITGFRIHPGGAQAWFGVEADIATYGKIVGGGMPIGVIAGKAMYLDGIDGGIWNYGDDSYPEAETTFFGGTFSRNPLAMVAAHAVLVQVKLAGLSLYQQLNQRTNQFAQTINAFFTNAQVPIQVVNFGSLFRFAFTGNASLLYQPLEMDLFYYHLIEQGVYVWEGRTCFLSTAHTDEDINQIVRAIEATVRAMQAGGFWPDSAAVSSTRREPQSPATLLSPVTATVETSVAPRSSKVWDRQSSVSRRVDRQSGHLHHQIDSSRANSQKTLDFSLYYFGEYEAQFSQGKYDLLFAGAKFADRHDFKAIWIPERHFHSFGGFSPNPSVLGASLARETEKIHIRAGSVVLPLHHPIRVAEEWSVVDNLSQGRVGIAFASGWHPNDFVFAPESYGNHRELMFQGIETVQKLWHGESIPVRGGAGNEIDVQTFPLPMQSQLPTWITVVNNPDTYIKAGEIGAGVLTNLMNQSVEDLAENISLYRESLAQNGYDPLSGQVTVLLHTLLGNNIDIVRQQARQPFCNYLRSSLGLFQNLVKSQGLQVDIDSLSEDDKNFILSAAFDRYVQNSALIGTPDSCTPIINNLLAIGVDEIACFIDFGVDMDIALAGLPYVNELKERYQHFAPDIGEKSLQTSDETVSIPLTKAQQQLWFLVQLGDNSSAAYNESVILQLRGELKLAAMQQALQKVVDRHEALRTRIDRTGDVQHISPTVKIDVPIIDFSDVSNDRKETQVAAWLQEDSQTPFDFTQSSLFRCRILKLEARQHLLVVCAHHIITDGWSMGILLQEIAAIYSAECQGTDLQLPSPRQFLEYAQWLEQQVETAAMATHQSYWLEQLYDPIPVLELPTDRPRRATKTFRANRQTIRLETNLSNDLRKISREQGCTLFMTMLSAYKTLLHRLTGQADILIGIPTAGRSLAGSKELIGYCTHLLPIRSQFIDNSSFLEYLQTLRGVLLDAYEHQDYPYANLLYHLSEQKQTHHSPLITATFNLEPSLVTPEMSGLDTSLYPGPIGCADHDLSLNIIEVNTELLLSCDYSTDLFDAATISRMLGHFQTLLAEIIVNPDRQISTLPILTSIEQQLLLVDWNDTQADYPQDKCIHQLFEEQSEKTPDAVAVVFEEQELTYRQLNQRANQLAHYLQTLGVKPEELVGICVERSLEMVVGLLGILKAGGAYVPLDPSYPAERLSYLLSDSGVKVLLTQDNLLSSLPSHDAQMICLDSEGDVIDTHSQENPIASVSTDNLAYVIYTSGSTGQPKGVMIPHRNLVKHAVTIAAEYNLTPSDRVLQFAALSFDVALEEILPAWLSGAIVVLNQSEMFTSMVEWVEFIETQSLTVLNLPAAFWHEWVVDLSTSQRDLPSCLRLVIVGSEQVQWSRVALWQKHVSSHIELYNAYGVTEATITATVYKLALGNQEQRTGIVPIGRPISNTPVYILDQQMQPVPIGVAGELHIGGDGLARGYLNRPELTQTQFLPNHFLPKKSARLYKTGDLARYLPDGNIEFLGRIDHQVKIRGFRIELGEIEAVLGSHPQIQQTVAIMTADAAGNQRLVAYVVSENEHFSSQQLREFLQQQLPAYMVPFAFVILDTLPLTPNGKVDRKALPAIDGDIDREREYVAPRTPNQAIIAHIFTTVLGIETVSIHDNFFELGGHSLLATQLTSRLKQSFTVDIPLRAVFEAPTIAQLDRTINQLRTEVQGWSLPAITRIAPESESIPLSFAQERLWFLNQLEGASATYNMPAALRLTGELNLDAFDRSLAEIVRRHESLRTSFLTIDGTPQQIIHSSAKMGMEVIDLQHLSDDEQKLIVKQQVQQSAITPFDLEIAPLIRCGLLQLSGTDYVFCINMHHIISDGWSIGVFVQELSALYPAFCNGNPSPLPELAIQYTDFTLWQKQWLSGEVLERQIHYWVSQLQGAPELLQLPTDRPRPSVQTYQGTTQSFSLSTELTQSLQALSRQTGSTLYMTLLAAFATLLYRYSGESDVVIGSSIANRNRSEIEPLIGFFVNTLVLRTRLEDRLSFEQLLTQVRATTLTAYEHQDVPFEQVVEALQPQRSLSHSPLFQVMFEIQNTPLGEIKLPGVKLSELNSASTVAKFDLNLSMTETPLGLDCDWEYNTDLFDASTIERMATHFENLLSAIVENPHQAVSELPLLSAIERQQLLVKWNDTQTSDPLDQCFPQLFEAQVARTPEAIAVVCGDKQLTYQQLNTRANRWAHQLVASGVGTETLVALLSERNIDFLTAMLAVFKAGGAYLPLNPDHPAERIRQVIEKSQVALVLTASGYRTQISSSAQILLLEHLDQAECSSGNLSVNCTPHNLAYVIYTSGSTGTPKGAMLEHRGMLNHLSAKVQDLQLTSADIVAQTANQTFDISIWQFLAALMVGGRVEIISQEMAADPVQLLSLVERQQISILEIVPSLLRAILHQIPHLTTQNPAHLGNGTANSAVRAIGLQKQLESLRWLILTGEALSPQLCRQWFEICPTIPMMNAYGPTECSDDVTHYPLAAPPAVEVLNLSIGRPVANTQLYILDPRLQPLPIGITGELYVGGMGVGRGYLNHPQLTQVAFIPDPFSSDKSARLYKTGDLARYLSDGNIEFLGRIDHQVKIRGFRIELGEIETLLSHHPQIQQAVVISTEDSAGNQRLVAYVVSEDDDLSSQQLREFLHQQLPAYMMPSAFVILDSLPLTPNGKVDRQALPAPAGEIDREHEYVAPQTEIEQILTTIWQELLLCERISIHDNFFEIGGDSILSIQVVSRAKTAGVQITPKQIFQHQTIAALARVANTNTIVVNTRQDVVIGVAPLTPIQHWFWTNHFIAAHHYNQSVLLQTPPDLSSEFIATACQKLLEHHDALRLRFPSADSDYQQINHGLEETVPFSVIDLSTTPIQSQPQALAKIATDIQASLNLSSGPIMQVVLFDLGSNQDGRLLIIIHHLAVDGVSWRILLSDLEVIYQQLTTQQPIQLSPKTTAFIDWAEKLHHYAQSEILKLELDYWLNQSWERITPIPLDLNSKPADNTIGSTATVSITLSALETHKLLGVVHEAYNTQINDLLLTGLALTLAEWTGNFTIIIDLEGHGREELFEEVDLSRTVGWFTSLFPVLLQLPRSTQPATAIKSIKEQLRAIPQRGLGYGILRYLCTDAGFKEQLQSIPTPEISFNYLGQFDQIQSDTGWKFAPEVTGQEQSSLQQREHILELDCLVIGGKLQIDWNYSSQIHHRNTIEDLAQSYLKNIRALIDHCQSTEVGGFTPSDFPEADLNQTDLDLLLSKINTL